MLYSLGLMIVVSALFVLSFRWLKIPNLLIYMFAGLLLGPGLGLIEASLPGEESHGPIAVISEVGIILLLFLVGLELSFERIRDVGPVAVAAGLGQVVFTAGIGFGLATLLGYEPMSAFFLATALTFSSTVVVVKLLDMRGDLHALYGRIAVGIFLVQDLVVIVALTFLAGLSGSGDPAELDLWSISVDLAWAFGGMALMLVGAVVASKYLLPLPFRWIQRSSEGLLVWSVTWCFAMVLAAEAFSLSPEIGAFLAGVALAQLGCAHDLMRRVHPIMNFFIAVFFVTLGVNMNLGSALDQWSTAIVLSLFVLLGNPLIFMIIITRFGYGEKTSFQTSVTVAQISEFSFIFAQMGVAASLIDEPILSVVAFVGLITISASTYMILYSDQLYAAIAWTGVLRIFFANQEPDVDEAEARPSDHVVVVGMNGLGRRIAAALHARGEAVLAIDVDAAKLTDLPCDTMVGDIDHPDVLDQSGALGAKLVVSALKIENVNNLLAWRCRQAGVPVAIHGFDQSVCADLQELDVTYVLNSKALGAQAMRAKLNALEVHA
ncbi:MAG: portal protein [Deltaproteobacteria bacterium]|nr:MAG: portal protein [Deltaproteobacteria bacterium]